MITCRFSGLFHGAHIVAEKLRFQGGQLYVDDSSEPVAVHVNAHWEFKKMSFVRIDVEGLMIVRLIAQVHPQGGMERTFSEHRIWFADGVLHSPHGHMMWLDEHTETWVDSPSCRRYREILLNS